MFFYALKIKDVKLEIGDLVKSYRKIEKISQDDLATKLNISRITIQNLESGKNFTIDTLLKVLQYFDLLGQLSAMVGKVKNENLNKKSLY